MKKFRQIIQNFAYSGELVNTTVVEWETETRQGDARNATAEDMAEIGDAAAAGYLAEIESLKTAHAAEIKALQDQLAAATAAGAAPSSASSALLADLDATFEEFPEAVQTAFEVPWVTVRNLMQAGKSARAYRFVQSLPVPPELEASRASILAKIAE